MRPAAPAVKTADIFVLSFSVALFEIAIEIR